MHKYTRKQVAAAVDLAALKPNHTSVDVSLCCQKAIRFGCASVCVQPYHVPIAARLLEDYPVAVGTVIGFPHGSVGTDTKMGACIDAVYAGAQELDMVLNVAAMLDGDWETIEEEIERAVEICQRHSVLLKVILETCYLKDRYIGYACAYAAKLGADFVKTSTGYGPQGATERHVRIMRDVVGDQCQVKASGGIATYAHAELFLELGCTRLGSSRIEALMPQEEA